ncbi:Exonuclease mut-7-like protein isoform X1 [Aphelenchoides besseyi]|nr:Exonuclease mut-7-like protein isoform X1 [Aphelenchoides besseyi]
MERCQKMATTSSSTLSTGKSIELVNGQNLSKYEKQLDQLYQQSDNNKRLYATFIDILLSTSTKSTELEAPDTTIRRLTILRRFMAYINDMESSRLQKAQSKLEYESESRVNAVFKLALATRWYDKFAHLFQNEIITAKFSVFLDSQIDNDLGRVLPWAFYSNCISQCNVEKIIARAVIDSRNNEKAHVGTIFNLMDTHSNIEAISRMVKYLDDTCALYMKSYYKKRPTGPLKEMHLAHEVVDKVCVNQLLKYINKLRMKCGLDQSRVPNAIFVRKMKTLLKLHTESISACGDAKQFFEQKVLHLMSSDSLMQHAVLRFYCRKDIELAKYFAKFQRAPEENWPRDLQELSEEQWSEISERVKAEKMNLMDEYNRYKGGMVLCKLSQGQHLTYVIDQPEELATRFYPFLEAETKFGIDAEWEQSYAGEVGTLGLLQISTKMETMLFDVVAFTMRDDFGKDQWMELFSRLFNPKNRFYGFALDSDLKAILHNFPFLMETEFPKTSKMICLRNLLQSIMQDKIDVYERLFDNELPTALNLAEVVSKVINLTVPKMEQASVWTYRPLRQKQIRYAAMDSFLCVTLERKLNQKLSDLIGKEMAESKFETMAWPIKTNVTDGNHNILVDVQNMERPSKKTKVQHFSNDELIALVNSMNHKLQASGTPTVPSYTRRYIVDSMCSQLGALLRRCGMSVFSGNEPSVIIERCTNDTELRILSCGKAVNKFPFPDRVLNIAASSSTLDAQLIQLLELERLIIDVGNLNSRCIRCNSMSLLRVPTAVMRYMHMRFTILNAPETETCDYSPEDMFRAQQRMKHINKQPFLNYAVGVCDGDLGHLYIAPNGMIDLKDLTLRRLYCYSTIKNVGRIPLTLATHINYTTGDFPPGTMHAICSVCGKESPEASTMADINREISC